MTPNFDLIARPYRWLEYLTLGPELARCRGWHLASGALDGARQALVLGDGDGRFTAQLLRQNGQVRVEAVDCSGAMLRLLTRRCQRDGGRVRAVLADARSYVPAQEPDLVVTQFFLDCLTQEECEALIERLAGARVWVVSEFRVPEGFLRVPARVLIGLLYFAFRVLTGLRVREIPDYRRAMRLAGFEVAAEKRFLFGILTTEVWRRAKR